MNVYLLKNQFIDMLLKKQEFSSAYNGDIKTFYLLDADKDVWNGKGDLQENSFPWIVSHVIDLDHSFDFKIKLKFTISKIQMPPSADVVIRVRADYREILKYVYSTYSLPRVLILKFTGVLTYPESDERVQITDESWSTAMECEFRFSISACFAEKVIMAQKVRLECVTLQLLGEEEPFPRRVIAGAIVETAHINSSANFTQDLTQTNQRELSLSDEGMTHFWVL
ncbi:unnamed protein product [Orchesella dallaii]|uniref:Uncharacterized protein n=1 Tax=Orchesella dallaii TaxID=48710 RepID=A0ABP1R525_9HEXA